MRYDNWDVILFPEDSNIPIPEYRTACYLSRDEGGYEVPTLRTYIGSLKPETSFRISLHHWGAPKASFLIQEAQRKTGGNVAFTVQVVVDGSRLYHGSFELNNSSPQEIAFEQRSFKSFRTIDQPSSQAKKRLSFPQGDKSALLQSSTWQPRGTDNRIKVILSEQLIDDHDVPGTAHWDIVCFSFQHAPRHLLEQVGIAYPIIDPLRAFMTEQATLAIQSTSRNVVARELQRRSRIHSRASPEFGFKPVRPANPKPQQQPSTLVPSLPQYPPQFMGHRGGGHSGWYNASRSFGEPDHIGMRSFPSQLYASNMSGLEGFCDPSFPAQAMLPWAQNSALSGQLVNSVVHSKSQRKDKNAQQVMMALRDDQFGQILEPLSLPKAERSQPNGLPITSQSHRPPKIGALSVPVRPSSAVMARTIPDYTTSSQNRIPSSDQANFEVAAPTKHNRRTDNQGSLIHTPIPFVLAPQHFDSDVSMRDGSPHASSLSRLERNLKGPGSKASSSHALAAVNSRKEGLAAELDNSRDLDVRHNQILLVTGPDQTPHDNNLEVIDVDAIDPSLTADLAKLSPFKPCHKARMSSVSSTGRLERQLYSALGEELGSFEQMTGNEMGPGLTKALAEGIHNEFGGSTMLDPMTEPAKRKRQGTFGGERDQSPIKKREKQSMVEDEEISDNLPQLRGD